MHRRKDVHLRACRLGGVHQLDVLLAQAHVLHAEQVVRDEQLLDRAVLAGSQHVPVPIRDALRIGGQHLEERLESEHFGRGLRVSHPCGDRRLEQHFLDRVLVCGGGVRDHPLRLRQEQVAQVALVRHLAHPFPESVLREARPRQDDALDPAEVDVPQDRLQDLLVPSLHRFLRASHHRRRALLGHLHLQPRLGDGHPPGDEAHVR
mmetsp:Transcript_30851/g.77039  ORF Transcript_30851/g.77039 Transcript_30851/m.77039 type:complete len:206 (+) Transcript_30851:352-969(+)